MSRPRSQNSLVVNPNCRCLWPSAKVRDRQPPAAPSPQPVDGRAAARAGASPVGVAVGAAAATAAARLLVEA